MQKMNVVRWGMIGCGSVTERKSAPAYRQVQGSQLVAVASRNPASAQAYAKREAVGRVFADPQQLIHSPEVDAVYIATPPSAHFQLAMAVAEARKPCCVEKPLCLTSSQSDQLVEAFEAAGQPLFVAYYRRSLPRFRQVKTWIHQGLIGQVRHVHWSLARAPSASDRAGNLGWRASEEEAPGGYFDDLACHGLDLLDYLVAPIAEASGVGTNQQGLYQVPDAVAASWKHANGTTGSGFWNFAASGREDEVRLIGSEGEARFAIFNDTPLFLQRGPETQRVEIANPDPIQLHHVENMIRHLEGKNLHPSSGASAARTDRVMELIRAGSASTGISR